ncbi:MAG: hypothetical protein DRI57_19610 [Deltaproteobacteria bacterium]|nr:MAG: hypothetical protein DRI57_19610 [Deltaproteobacteria bacterium]
MRREVTPDPGTEPAVVTPVSDARYLPRCDGSGHSHGTGHTGKCQDSEQTGADDCPMLGKHMRSINDCRSDSLKIRHFIFIPSDFESSGISPHIVLMAS